MNTGNPVWDEAAARAEKVAASERQDRIEELTDEMDRLDREGKEPDDHYHGLMVERDALTRLARG